MNSQKELSAVNCGPAALILDPGLQVYVLVNHVEHAILPAGHRMQPVYPLVPECHPFDKIGDVQIDRGPEAAIV